MDERPDSEDTVEEREEIVEHALHSYRERRRRRRGEDTFFGSLDALLEQSEKGLEPREVQRRRSDLIDEAVACGMSHDLAELLYEVAREEGLDPGLGLELVKSGLGVCPPPDGISNESAAPASDKYLPPWMFPASPTDHMLRERTLHVSFRRLRSLLESHHDIEEAFRSFAREPDVGHCGY